MGGGRRALGGCEGVHLGTLGGPWGPEGCGPAGRGDSPPGLAGGRPFSGVRSQQPPRRRPGPGLGRSWLLQAGASGTRGHGSPWNVCLVWWGGPAAQDAAGSAAGPRPVKGEQAPRLAGSAGGGALCLGLCWMSRSLLNGVREEGPVPCGWWWPCLGVPGPAPCCLHRPRGCRLGWSGVVTRDPSLWVLLQEGGREGGASCPQCNALCRPDPQPPPTQRGPTSAPPPGGTAGRQALPGPHPAVGTGGSADSCGHSVDRPLCPRGCWLPEAGRAQVSAPFPRLRPVLGTRAGTPPPPWPLGSTGSGRPLLGVGCPG